MEQFSGPVVHLLNRVTANVVEQTAWHGFIGWLWTQISSRNEGLPSTSLHACILQTLIMLMNCKSCTKLSLLPRHMPGLRLCLLYTLALSSAEMAWHAEAELVSCMCFMQLF